MSVRFVFMIAAAALFATPAAASVRSFFSPTIEGVPVAVCLNGTSACGKPAADAYCRSEGYDRSVLFERHTAPAARTLESGETCSGSACTAFRQIKCFSVKDDLANLGG